MDKHLRIYLKANLVMLTFLVQTFLKFNAGGGVKNKQAKAELDVVSLNGLEPLHFCQVCSVF